MVAQLRPQGEAFAEIPIAEITVPKGRRPVGDIDWLIDSIKEIGLINPITVTENYRLVAGLHRLEAFKRLGRKAIAASIIALDSVRAELAEIDENLIRNDYSVLERGEKLKRRKEIYEALHPQVKRGVAGGRARQGAASEIISFADDAAAKTGKTARTVQQEVQIASKLTSEVKDKIRDTPIADNKIDLLKLSRLKAEEQKEVATQVATGKAETVTQAISGIRREQRVEKINEVSKKNAPLKGKATLYPVILADPAWRYDFSKDDADKVENHYPTMAVEDICAIKVPEVSAPSAVLFLWATAPKMPEAMRVIDAWGFKYVSHIIWDKENPGNGYWSQVQHELLLIAKKGDFPAPPPDARPRSVIRIKKGKHSAKPEVVHEIIEKMFPKFAKAELFARTQRPGWSCWGNEVEVNL